MKKYDRETKKWIDEEEVNKKLSQRQQCKGGKDHDYVLCLPSYVRHDDSVLGIDIAEKYYAIEDAREDAGIVFDEQLEDLGLKTRLWRGFHGRRRSYICTVCYKQK